MVSLFSSTMLFFFACSGGEVSESSDSKAGADKASVSLEGAYKDLIDGNLIRADKQFQKAVASDETQVSAATGAAYLAMLRGDFDEADSILKAAQASEKPKILLRRALVALQAKDFEKVKEHGLASNTDQGKLLAAEVEILDGELENAAELLSGLSFKNDKYTALQEQYLKLIKSSDFLDNNYATAQAQWALGDYSSGVEDAASNLPKMKMDDKDLAILLWAGRAASIGDYKSGSLLLPSKKKLRVPRDMKWRVGATKALINCAKRNEAGIKSCVSFLTRKLKNAPQKGLDNAKVTAASLIADVDPASAKSLVKGINNNAAAQVLSTVGDKSAALEAAEDGIYSTMLD